MSGGIIPQKGVIQEAEEVGDGQAIGTDQEHGQGNQGEIEHPSRSLTVENPGVCIIVGDKSRQEQQDAQACKLELAFQGPGLKRSEHCGNCHTGQHECQ